MLLFILIGLWLNPTSANPPVVLTVCEAFYAGSLYEGRNVYIVGRLASTNEGSWISHGHCACAIDGYAGYTKLEIAPLCDPDLQEEPDFEDAGPAIAEKLRAVVKEDKLRAGDRWVVSFGRFHSAFFSESQSGFGHLAAARGALFGPKLVKLLTPPKQDQDGSGQE